MRYAADETRQFPVSLHRIVPKRLGYRWQWVVGSGQWARLTRPYATVHLACIIIQVILLLL